MCYYLYLECRRMTRRNTTSTPPLLLSTTFRINPPPRLNSSPINSLLLDTTTHRSYSPHPPGATTVTVNNLPSNPNNKDFDTAIEAELRSQFDVENVNELAHHVVRCLPPNTKNEKGEVGFMSNAWNGRVTMSGDRYK